MVAQKDIFSLFLKAKLEMFSMNSKDKINELNDLLPQRLKSLCSPSEEWHPYLDVHRGERYSKERCRHRMNRKNKPEVNVHVISSSWL